MSDDTSKIIRRIEDDFKQKVAQAEQSLDAPPDGKERSAEVIMLADRLAYAMRAADAHGRQMMPWRAGYKIEEDCVWCTEVCAAVTNKRARPVHPDPDIEEVLQNAFSS